MNRKTRVRLRAWMPLSILLSVVVLAGYGTPGAAPVVSKSPLADTEWRLLEIQSMDDSVGSTRPDDPSLYTMRLNADGPVNMRLNCNFANGNWSAETGPDRTSGRFEFGPLAGTRASVLLPA